ncbi:MAG: type III-B CRISPR module RAMP protein Cmr4 [Bacteroidia bacterium]|nr:type III-B CRISPR module RAMP protein Cmr4 [Bacteroidia bacterium]
MHQQIHPLFLICQTPLHAGSGSELGVVDLPIQRERHTSFPKIEASTLKGSIRNAIERAILRKSDNKKNDIKMINQVFGFDEASLPGFSSDDLKRLFREGEGEAKTEFASCLGFTDARLLLFPVKSMKGVFAWITCPKVLKQFVADIELTKRMVVKIPEISSFFLDQHQCVTTPKSALTVKSREGKNVILEEYTFGVSSESEELVTFGKWLANNILPSNDQLWREKLETDIVILPNDDFKDFVNLSTEVITRTKINNETGTVQDGALFTEEYLPAESVLYTMVLTSDEFKANGRIEEPKVREFFNKHLPPVIQIGGNATLGKGMVNTKFLNPHG